MLVQEELFAEQLFCLILLVASGSVPERITMHLRDLRFVGQCAAAGSRSWQLSCLTRHAFLDPYPIAHTRAQRSAERLRICS